jgi:hypothetical protein
MTQPIQPPQPPVDLYKDRRLRTAIRDVRDCRRLLRQEGEPHSWLDAFQLHLARVEAHAWAHRRELR